MWGGLPARAGPAARQKPDLGVRLRTTGPPHVSILLGPAPRKFRSHARGAGVNKLIDEIAAVGLSLLDKLERAFAKAG
jgi:hypothetical protein